MTRNQKNRLIMAFMRIKPKVFYGRYQWGDGVHFGASHVTEEYVIDAMANYLKFDSSWDKLMPVVQAIYNEDWEAPGNLVGDITTGMLNTDVTETYEAVVAYIIQFNKQL